jgi:nitrogen fixation protein FixH
MLLVITGFFAVIIGVNITLAVFATGTWTGLVVENAYVASQHFNEDLDRAHRQQALGWHAALSYRAGTLRLDLTGGRSGAPLPGMTVEAILQRPTHEGEDRTVVLTRAADGAYRADLDLPAGTWKAEIHAADALGRAYRRDFRLWVPQEK